MTTAIYVLLLDLSLLYISILSDYFSNEMKIRLIIRTIEFTRLFSFFKYHTILCTETLETIENFANANFNFNETRAYLNSTYTK